MQNHDWHVAKRGEVAGARHAKRGHRLPKEPPARIQAYREGEAIQLQRHRNHHRDIEDNGSKERPRVLAVGQRRILFMQEDGPRRVAERQESDERVSPALPAFASRPNGIP